MGKVSHPVTNSTFAHINTHTSDYFRSKDFPATQPNRIPRICVTFEIDPFHSSNASPMNTGNFVRFRSLTRSTI